MASPPPELIERLKISDNSTKKKTNLIILWKNGKNGYFFTCDEETIEYAKQVIIDQETPIGTKVIFQCEIRGTKEAEYGIDCCNLERIINCLNKKTNWVFKTDP